MKRFQRNYGKDNMATKQQLDKRTEGINSGQGVTTISEKVDTNHSRGLFGTKYRSYNTYDRVPMSIRGKNYMLLKKTRCKRVLRDHS